MVKKNYTAVKIITTLCLSVCVVAALYYFVFVRPSDTASTVTKEDTQANQKQESPKVQKKDPANDTSHQASYRTKVKIAVGVIFPIVLAVVIIIIWQKMAKAKAVLKSKLTIPNTSPNRSKDKIIHISQTNKPTQLDIKNLVDSSMSGYIDTTNSQQSNTNHGNNPLKSIFEENQYDDDQKTSYQYDQENDIFTPQSKANDILINQLNKHRETNNDNTLTSSEQSDNEENSTQQDNRSTPQSKANDILINQLNKHREANNDNTLTTSSEQFDDQEDSSSEASQYYDQENDKKTQEFINEEDSIQQDNRSTSQNSLNGMSNKQEDDTNIDISPISSPYPSPSKNNENTPDKMLSDFENNDHELDSDHNNPLLTAISKENNDNQPLSFLQSSVAQQDDIQHGTVNKDHMLTQQNNDNNTLDDNPNKHHPLNSDKQAKSTFEQPDEENTELQQRSSTQEVKPPLYRTNETDNDKESTASPGRDYIKIKAANTVFSKDNDSSKSSTSTSNKNKPNNSNQNLTEVDINILNEQHPMPAHRNDSSIVNIGANSQPLSTQNTAEKPPIAPLT